MRASLLGLALAASSAPLGGEAAVLVTSKPPSFVERGEHHAQQNLEHQSKHRHRQHHRQHRLHPSAVKQDTPALVHTKSVASSKRGGRTVCRDDPVGWKSKTGADCHEYESRKWCSPDGGHGEGWSKDYGDFKDWVDELGKGAKDACCACGGGLEVSLQRGPLGGPCEEGVVIQAEKECRQAASAIGAGYAMTAHWPIGQPAGCHVDADGKTVWLNTSPKGTSPHPKYASLCEGVVSEDKDDKSEDGDDDDYDKDDEEEKEKTSESHREAAKMENTEEREVFTRRRKKKMRRTSPEGREKKEEDEEDITTEKKEEDEEAAKMENAEEHVVQRAPEAREKKEEDEEESAEEESPERKAVVTTHAALAHNIKRRVEVGVELHKLSSMDASDIEARVESLSSETKSPELARFLGDMWKEQRRFEVPVYKAHLQRELAKLEGEAEGLQAAYDDAKQNLEAKEAAGDR